MPFDLPWESKKFADDLSALLNATVCHGPQLNALAFPNYTVVGYHVSRDNVRGEGLPIRIRKAPKFYLGLSIRLQPKDDYLTVMSSAMVLATEATITNANMLLHYDYERDKQDGYPEAHLQICASSDTWEEAGRRHDGDVRLLNKLHLPVGGRRFRPTLEDILEFLIVEKLVEARPNWNVALDASRDAFREKQLRAAVRQFPHIALDQLERDKHLP
ncbi:hypothetical protein [Mycobacterium persicum]|uniref:hypothetical protein n=1 Tax=Mycobacterium persicum TaxID=1487726 RepID=UPI001593FE5F|nr:hypothetical protein [Mycobacterium persicum]